MNGMTMTARLVAGAVLYAGVVSLPAWADALPGGAVMAERDPVRDIYMISAPVPATKIEASRDLGLCRDD